MFGQPFAVRVLFCILVATVPSLPTSRADDGGVHGCVLLELHVDLRHLGVPLRLRRPRSPLQVHHTKPLEGPLNTARLNLLRIYK